MGIICLVLAERYHFMNTGVVVQKSGADEWNRYDHVDETAVVDVDSNAVTEGENMDLEFTSAAKRNKMLHPCQCASQENRTDFDSNTYPSYVFEKICNKTANEMHPPRCGGRSSCKELYHKIYVLKHKPNHTEGRHNPHNVPKDMRPNFYWEYKVMLFKLL